jgi:glycosyltransferase involved in cell wall biosynthesis
MRIVILAHNLRFAGGRSVGVNVITALARVADEHDYLLFLPRGLGYEALPKPTRSECLFVARKFGPISQMAFERSELPRRVAEFGPDVVWGLGNFGLPHPPCRQAVLFHKAHFLYPWKNRRGEPLKNRLVNWAIKRRLARSLPATQLVLCQTEVTARRFPQCFRYTGRIALMPNAVSEATKAGDVQERPPVFGRLRGKFVLFCLTSYYTHKNLESLIEIYRRWRRELRDTAVVFTVSPAGGRRARAFLHSIERYGLHDHLVNVGPVTQSELPGYFAASASLILPTILESFSATYIEAMQYDCPILTSDLDFARVVCGDAALYFDPFSPESIRDAILKLQSSPDLRAKLVARGAERRKTYARDWDSIVSEAVRELSTLVAPAPATVASASG